MFWGVNSFLYVCGFQIAIEGAICSSADITPTVDGTAWEIYMDTVEIKGSNIPGLRQMLNSATFALKSRNLSTWLEGTKASLSSLLPSINNTDTPIIF